MPIDSRGTSGRGRGHSQAHASNADGGAASSSISPKPSSDRGGLGGGPSSTDLAITSFSELDKTLKSIPYSPARPARPGFGTLGKAGVLRANFFPVGFPKTGALYDYHVKITPKTELKSIKARLFALLEESNHPGWQEYVPFIAHDGSARLVSSKKLPRPLDIPILFLKEGQANPGKQDKTYTFSITLTQELNSNGLVSFINGDPDSRYWDFGPITSAINLVLQHHASHNGVRVGKNRYFFPSSGQPLELSIGVEAWRGFFMSARPVYKELMVNVGVCMTAFYKPGNLADVIREFQQQSDRTMLRWFAQKLKVTTSHLGYRQTKPLKRIMNTSAKQTSFQCDELKGTVTVEEYFKRKYRITLRYPNMPVVDISGPNARHPILVPPELCEILPGQPFRGELDDEQTTQMIDHACKTPAESAQTILNQGLPQLGLTPNNQKLFNFGLSVSHNMADIPFRELPSPSVTYRDGMLPSMNNGSWNILDAKFYRGCVIKSWWILVVKEKYPGFEGLDDPQLVVLWKGFAENCQRSGMTGINPYSEPALLNVVVPVVDPGRQQSLSLIRSTIKDNQARRGKPSFVLVILARRDNDIYSGIKRICDVELGIHTVHMLSNTILTNPEKRDQYFSNVALKMNTKLGGINHKIDDQSLQWLAKKGTMLVGMNVTHPGPGSIEGTPSIAAVVASVDDNFAQFPASMRCQWSNMEIITDLSDMLVERLRRYQAVSNALPEQVYVFRSGISNGVFDVLLKEELPQIIDAFRAVSSLGGPHKISYRPRLTIMTCGKRRHTRMWVPDALGNTNDYPRAGTVVDQGITTAFDFDFYLQAHGSPSTGQPKSTHYTVLYDENELSADGIQQGVNTASYLYARATKAISFIPPVVYANLACKRGRCYLNDFFTPALWEREADGEEEWQNIFEAAKKAWGSGVHPSLAESMFYI